MSVPEAHGVAVDIAAASTSPMPVSSSPATIRSASLRSRCPFAPSWGAIANSSARARTCTSPAIRPRASSARLALPPRICPSSSALATGATPLRTRADAPSAVVVRRFDVVSSGMTPGLGMTGVTVVTDSPLVGQHDVAMLGGRPVVVSAHRNLMTLATFVRVARLAELHHSGERRFGDARPCAALHRRRVRLSRCWIGGGSRLDARLRLARGGGVGAVLRAPTRDQCAVMSVRT